MAADELRTELRSGKTIAQVAADQGVDVQDVIDALVADVKAHLDEEVASGEHTQAEADAKLAEVTARITDRVNNGKPDKAPADQPPVTTAG
jgi:lipoate-protein ligase A